MNRLLLPLIVLAFSAIALAQPFHPDEFGHVSDPKFKAFIQARNYQLVGAFCYYRHTNDQLFAKVRKNNEWIYIDVNGKEFDDLPDLGNDNPVKSKEVERGEKSWDSEKIEYIESGKKRGLIYDGDTIALPIYDEIKPYDYGQVIIVKNDGLMGALDPKGKVVIPLVYDRVQPMRNSNPFQLYVTKDGLTGVISAEGKEIIPTKYYYLLFETTYYSFVKLDGKKRLFGALDLEGNSILSPIYDVIDGSYPNHFVVKYKGKIGITDLQGKLVIDTVYSDYKFYNLSMTLIELKRDAQFHGSAVFDCQTGKLTFPAGIYEIGLANRHGRMITDRRTQPNLCGWINNQGQITFEPKYTEIKACNTTNFLIAKNSEKYGVIDTMGKVVLKFQYEKLDHFDYLFTLNASKKQDLFVFTSEGKKGIIDHKGKVLIPAQYEILQPNSSGVLCVIDGKVSLLDLSGKTILKTELNPREGKIEKGLIDAEDCVYDLYGNKLCVTQR